MDFYEIKERSRKPGVYEIYPDFVVCRSKDLMVRGKSFYAIWDEEKGLWSTDEYDVQRLVDQDLYSYRDSRKNLEGVVSVSTMRGFSSNSWVQFRKYLSNISDNNHQLDEKLTFSNTVVKKEDYVSKRLPYALQEGSIEAYDKILSTLYDPDERAKMEWAIGAIVSGDSRDIQKFVVLYGEQGAGKSTVLNIIQKLFPGYYTTFEAKALTSQNDIFSTEVFRTNPLVAIQHDGDLSRIEDNTKLNSIVSHEEMPMHEKFKPTYTARTNCFLFMATNKPVKITDAKSGVIRRLIDVTPSGRKLPSKEYFKLMKQIDFELGGIAWHCLQVYQKMGKNYYSAYKPLSMIYQTDVFFNFVESYYDEFKKCDGISLSRAYDLYKTYCDEALVDYKLARHKFREELKNYFYRFDDVTRVDGKQIRSWYSGFDTSKFTSTVASASEQKDISEKVETPLILEYNTSLLDGILSGCPAQYAKESGTPLQRWSEVKTKLSDLDTKKLHYVKVPPNHVVIDFDLKDSEGNKSAEMNLAAASLWPKTYAEFSQGGSGVHLHYIYDGDVSRLSSVFAPGIEVKVFNGNSSLRRRLSKCNNLDIAHLSGGLPLKEAKKVVDFNAIISEKGIRGLILRNLNKEIHPGTKPSVDFIKKILDDAYESGAKYDVSDLRQKIFSFAMNSTNHSAECMAMVGKMKFRGQENEAQVKEEPEGDLIFFDIEVFPNLLLVNWKYAGEGKKVVRMINPESGEIETLMKNRLIGFNCRRYDNHILYARYLGYSIEQIYMLSKRIIDGDSGSMFGEAYDVSYTDVYDFSSKKQSLKKFEIELGIHHQELGMPWDQPVPEDKWEQVAEYCDNDVIATEAVFNARKADWTARQILAAVAGMTVNDTTNSLTTKIIFGSDRKPQSQFNYRDMGDVSVITNRYDKFGIDPNYTCFDENWRPIFPGYNFQGGRSVYRDEEVGEGGYVYAEPGVHFDVALLDIASMHPSSIVAENLFGDKYTARFREILEARIAIKHKDFDRAREMLDGKLAGYLQDENAAADLAQALKIAINSVYGLTSAKFDNPFRDIRNKDNIVAKRGALFMVNLKHEVQARGFTVAHIKTDSIKIPNATPEIIQFVMDYGHLYGYNFEHEATYERMCLVNDAVYIARYLDGKHAGEWTATGAQFQQPYVFKTLFSKEPIRFEDLCETKTVTGSLYLDMNERLPDVSQQEKELDKIEKELKDIWGASWKGILSDPPAGLEDNVDISVIERSNELVQRRWHLLPEIEKGHDYHFVGKAGLFSPIKPDCGGGILLREKDGKYYAVGGTKGFRWLESEVVEKLGKQDDVDLDYYRRLVDDAIHDISQYYDFEVFVSEQRLDYPRRPTFETPPWQLPCGETKYNTCLECPHCKDDRCDAGYNIFIDVIKGGAQ